MAACCVTASFTKAEIQQKPNYIYTEIGYLVEILHGDEEIISLPDRKQFVIISWVKSVHSVVPQTEFIYPMCKPITQS